MNLQPPCSSSADLQHRAQHLSTVSINCSLLHHSVTLSCRLGSFLPKNSRVTKRQRCNDYEGLVFCGNGKYARYIHTEGLSFERSRILDVHTFKQASFSRARRGSILPDITKFLSREADPPGDPPWSSTLSNNSQTRIVPFTNRLADDPIGKEAERETEIIRRYQICH
jgi:hypothetical protein